MSVARRSGPRLNRNVALGGFLLAASLGLLVWLDLAYIMPIKSLNVPNPDNDLSVFWTGARTVWQGGNPYDFNPGSLFHRIANGAGGDSDIFLSPFYLSLLFLPLAILPLNVAGLVWLVLIQVMLGVSVALIIRISGLPILPGRLLGCLGLAILWRYTFEVMILNNLSLVMLFAVVASYYCSRTGRPYRAGLLAALLLLKPQLAFLTLPLLLVVPTIEADATGQKRVGWLNRQTYRRWAGFGTVCLIYGVYSFGVYPGWVSGFLGSAGGRYTSQFDNEMTSVRSFVAGVLGYSSQVSTVYVSVAVVGVVGWLAVWWRNRFEVENFPFLLSITLCVNLLLAPYARSYDFCLLLVPLLLNFLVLRHREAVARQNGHPARLGWSLLWWPLIIVPWPLHLLAINTGIFALENILTASLLVITAFVWRSQPILFNRYLVKRPGQANLTKLAILGQNLVQ